MRIYWCSSSSSSFGCWCWCFCRCYVITMFIHHRTIIITSITSVFVRRCLINYYYCIKSYYIAGRGWCWHLMIWRHLCASWADRKVQSLAHLLVDNQNLLRQHSIALVDWAIWRCMAMIMLIINMIFNS